MDWLMKKLGKFTLIVVFTPIIYFIAQKVGMMTAIFGDYRLMELAISLVIFLAIIACKRGMWH